MSCLPASVQRHWQLVYRMVSVSNCSKLYLKKTQSNNIGVLKQCRDDELGIF